MTGATRSQWRVFLDVLDADDALVRSVLYSHRPTRLEAQARADRLAESTDTPEGQTLRWRVEPPEVPQP